jgi:hypothetical protein
VEAVGYPRPNELSLQGFGAKAGEVRNGISFMECASLETANWRHFGGNRSFVTNRLLAQAQSFVFS